MAIAGGSIIKEGSTEGILDFSGTFRFDAVALQVVSTAPPFPGGVFTLPGPFTYDVTFNEPINPASVQLNDLSLSGIAGAFVSAVVVQPGNTTIRFTLGGMTTIEGALTASIAGGSVTDAFGNPGTAFSATYQVDIGVVPYPTPLAAENPLGSLIYDPTISGTINFVGDTDGFTLALDPGQTLSVLVQPNAAGLRPTVEVRDGANVLVATHTAAAAGQNALIQAVACQRGHLHDYRSGRGQHDGNLHRPGRPQCPARGGGTPLRRREQLHRLGPELERFVRVADYGLWLIQPRGSRRSDRQRRLYRDGGAVHIRGHQCDGHGDRRPQQRGRYGGIDHDSVCLPVLRDE